MENQQYKNWNNFFLGLVVVVVPWLGLPLGLKKIIFVILGLLIALFSLARVQPRAKKNLPAQPVTNESNA
jgi:hypothetical protein